MHFIGKTKGIIIKILDNLHLENKVYLRQIIHQCFIQLYIKVSFVPFVKNISSESNCEEILREK